MMLKHRLVLSLAACALAACAAHPDPIIDMKGVDPQRLAADWEECEAYTEQISIAEGTARSAALGGAVGTAAGAIRGDIEQSAATGALYGGTRGGLAADRDKQKVFKRCLIGRGYRVLN